MRERVDERTVVVIGAEATAMDGLPTALDATDGLSVEVVPVAEMSDVSCIAGADALVVVDSPPDVDGVALFRDVRDAERTLPVFLVGAAVAPDRVEAALSAGVTSYLTEWEETRAEELAARLRAHLRRPALDGAVQAERWNEIVGSLAHDAKNPLNVVTGRLELLDVDETHSDAISRSVGRVETLLDELSAVATVTGPIPGDEPVDIGETAAHVWGELGGETGQLRIEEPGSVEADSDCLRLVLHRLLENARVHAGEDATVTVGAGESGFYIADDGPGLPDDAEQVFEQGYGTVRDGEGYGLFVAERVASAHGWDIVAGTSAKGGARFDVVPR